MKLRSIWPYAEREFCGSEICLGRFNCLLLGGKAAEAKSLPENIPGRCLMRRGGAKIQLVQVGLLIGHVFAPVE
jgi:hypothetical protein